MNSMERILATLAGKPTDRKAISLTLSLYGARLTSCDLIKYYSDSEAFACGQFAVRERFQSDVIFAPFSIPLFGGAFGGSVKYFKDHPPNLKRPAIKSVKEIEHLKVPDIDSDSFLTYIRDTVSIMASKFQKETPIAVPCLSPIDLPIMIMGLEAWLETVLFDPKGTKQILELTIPFFVKWTDALFSSGATCLVILTAFMNTSILPRFTAIDIALPVVKKAFNQIKGPWISHSTGAKMNPFLDLFLDIPNLVGFCVNSDDDLDESRRILGGGPTLLGNVDGPSLHTRTANEIKEECLSILRSRSEDPNFILASSAADIDYYTPAENIHAFREAVKEFSKESVK